MLSINSSSANYNSFACSGEQDATRPLQRTAGNFSPEITNTMGKFDFFLYTVKPFTAFDSKYTSAPSTIVESHQRKWVRDARQRLLKMKNLEDGWDSYDAEPPTLHALKRAEEVLRRLSHENFCPSNVAPSVIGGVGFSFAANGRYAAIEIDNDDNVLVVEIGANGGSPRYWDFEFNSEKITDAIKKIYAFVQ